MLYPFIDLKAAPSKQYIKLCCRTWWETAWSRIVEHGLNMEGIFTILELKTTVRRRKQLLCCIDSIWIVTTKSWWPNGVNRWFKKNRAQLQDGDCWEPRRSRRVDMSAKYHTLLRPLWFFQYTPKPRTQKFQMKPSSNRSKSLWSINSGSTHLPTNWREK